MPRPKDTKSSMPKLQEEPAWEACAGLVYHLLTGRLAKDNIHNEMIELLLLRLLLADYGRRSGSLPATVQADLNSRVIGYLAAEPPQHLWAGLGKTLRAKSQADPLTLDVGIVTTSEEELRATALAFDAQETAPYHGGEPAYVVDLDSTHLTGRRLSVGVFCTDGSQVGSLGLLITHMRHRRIPRLVCLVGTAISSSRNVARFDIVAPRVVYRVTPDPERSEIDLTTAERLALRDPHLHGLEVYDPDHTGYQERLRALLRRIPRRYKVGIRSNQIKPNFAAASCVAVAGAPISSDLTQESGTVCIADTEAYEFAESLPGETWLIFRGVRGLGPDDVSRGENTYLAAAAAALCLRDFLENYYVPPGAADF